MKVAGKRFCIKCNKITDRYKSFKKGLKLGSCIECRKRYAKLNEDHIKKYGIQFRKKRISIKSEYDKKYRIENINLIKEKRKKYYIENKLKSCENRRLKFTYGITLEDYNRILKEQEGKCAICGTTEPKGNGNRLHVDHDHNNGHIRGLLCHFCNTGIGLLKDNIDILQKSINYLKMSNIKGLKEFINENFNGDNEVRAFISERGNQRIEIEDKSTNEVWQTLEATNKPDNKDDYSEIIDAIIFSLSEQLENTKNNNN